MPTSRTSRTDLLHSVIFVIVGLCILQGVDPATHSYVVPKWIGVAAATALILVVALVSVWLNREIRLDRVDGIVAVFAIFAAGSLIWSDDPAGGAAHLGGLIAALIVFCYARRCDCRKLGFRMALLCLLATDISLMWAAILPEYQGGFGNENRFAHALLLMMPYLALWVSLRQSPDRWLGLGLAFCAVVYLVAVNDSHAEYLVVVLLVLVVLLRKLLNYRRSFDVATGFLVAAGGVAVAWVLREHLLHVAPVEIRLEIGLNTIAVWLDQPVLGTGIGGFDFHYPTHQQTHLSWYPGFGDTVALRSSVVMDAAHNEPLQFLAEFGIAGFLLAALAALTVRRNVTPMACMTLVSRMAVLCLAIVAVISLFDFPLRTPATVSLAAVSLGLVVRFLPEVQAQSFVLGSRRLMVVTMLLVLGGLTASAAIPSLYLANRHNFTAIAITDVSPQHGYVQAIRSYKRFPLSPDYRRQLGVSYLRWLTSGVQRDIARAQDHGRIFRIGQSASAEQPGVLIVRIETLLLLGLTPAARKEIDPHLQTLKRVAPYLVDTHLIEATYANAIGDRERAQRALDRAGDVRSYTRTPQVVVSAARRRLGF